MTDVIAWPPVGIVGWEVTWHQPVSRSQSLLTGRSLWSSAQRPRRLVTAQVSGTGPQAAGSGYVEMLKEIMQRRNTRLVRVPVQSAVFHGARSRNRNAPIYWLAGEADLEWEDGASDLLWYERDYNAYQFTFDGWPHLIVNGLPPGQIVVRPGELVTLHDPETGTRQTARAVRIETANEFGNASIRLMDPITGTGQASFGDSESAVMEATDLPRAVQPLTGGWSYDWSFREVFADEFDGWTEVDPWR